MAVHPQGDKTTAVMVSSNSNIAPLQGVGQTLDAPVAYNGYVITGYERVLLLNQTDPLENGVWVTDPIRAWVRDPTLLPPYACVGDKVRVEMGGDRGGSTYVLTNTPVVGVAQDWQRFGEVRRGNLHGETKVLYHQPFLAPAGGTLPQPWATQLTGGAGTPTADFLTPTNNPFGQYSLICSNHAEVQTMTLDFNNFTTFRFYNAYAGQVFEFIWRYYPGGASPDPATDFCIGVASARQATIDALAICAIVRITSDSYDMIVECDDTNTRTVVNTGVATARNRANFLRIDMSRENDIRFEYAWYSSTMTPITVLASGIPFTGSRLVQPYVFLSKNSAARERFDVMDFKVRGSRRS